MDFEWPSVVMVALGRLQIFLSGSFWIVVYGFGCFQIVLGGFRRFSEMGSFSSYGEIPCFKFERSKQLWEDFAVTRKNDAKVHVKQMTTFFGNSKYKFSLKNTLFG